MKVSPTVSTAWLICDPAKKVSSPFRVEIISAKAAVERPKVAMTASRFVKVNMNTLLARVGIAL
ncbi:MAG: hypothetical protein ACJAZ1_002945 [Yoonia sp.]|jgi:hypothetical protein